MNIANPKTLSKVNILSIIGPIFVLLCVFLLIVRDSDFDIDLSMAAMAGLFFCWRWKLKGFVLASFLLLALVGYEIFAVGAIPLWEVGLIISLELAFLVTSLASLEFVDTVESIGESIWQEMTSWQEKANEALQGKTELEKKVDNLQTKLQTAFDGAKTTTEKAEMFERLLSIARNEMLGIAKSSEELQEKYAKEVQHSHKLSERIEDLEFRLQDVAKLKQIIEQKEEKEELVTELRGQVDALHQDKMQLESSFQKQISHSEIKIQDLSDQLDKLTDKLKSLQSEKETLEKAMDDLLHVEPVVQEQESNMSQLRRAEGLYLQLRGQFDEKSAVLNQTRKELFSTQEKLLIKNLELQEINSFSRDEKMDHYIRQLHRTIGDLEKEIEKYESIIQKMVVEF